MLQKNCLGLLLLAALLLSTYRYLAGRSIASLGAILALFALIAVTHLGTLAAALLFLLSLVSAVACERADGRRTAAWLALLAAGSGAGLLVVYLLDEGAFRRILRYARSSLPDSLLGNLIASEPAIRRPMAALGILVPLGLLLLLLRAWRKGSRRLDAPERILWLACIGFSYLLVLPLLDLDLVPRLVLFLPVPCLVVLGFTLRLQATGRLGAVLLIGAVGATAAMALGELVSLRLHGPHKAAVHGELLALRQRYRLTREDLVVTRYAVNPLCNWFLGTRSTLITALHRDAFGSSGRVYILNPRDGEAGERHRDHAGTAALSVSSEKQAYLITRRNVPVPPELPPVTETDHLRFYALEQAPRGWRFDSDGLWRGTVDGPGP
jgi:hypothetical protein